MKNGKKIIVAVLALLSFETLSSFASSQIKTYDGGRLILTKRKFSSRDFYTGNFFINEIGYSSFNVKIFDMMKNIISNGTLKGLLVDYEINERFYALVKKGKVIDCLDTGENKKLITYYAFDKKLKYFVKYTFALMVNESQYNSYADSIKALTSFIDECNKNIDLCEKNIKSCNEIIEKCSNPTIQKSRIVSVPYTVEIVTPILGKAGNPGTYTKTETYTEYRDEIEYYTVPNPNYNPNAVSKAKKDLQSWNNSKADWINKKNAAREKKANFPLPFALELVI